MKDNLMDKATLEATMSAREEMDRFIFETIGPFCEDVIHQTITKEALVAALTKYDLLKAERDKLKEERDAAVEDINLLGNSELALICDICALKPRGCEAQDGEGVCCFLWRGVVRNGDESQQRKDEDLYGENEDIELP